MNPMRPADDWHHLRLVLCLYDLEVGDHPSVFARELFDEALLLVRLKCGEDVGA
jgi:hypothetical protein